MPVPCFKISFQQGGEGDIKPSNTLFVGNVAGKDTRQCDLEDYFGRFGRLARVEIRDSHAFVQYEEAAQAEAAMRETHLGVFMGAP